MRGLVKSFTLLIRATLESQLTLASKKIERERERERERDRDRQRERERDCVCVLATFPWC